MSIEQCSIAKTPCRVRVCQIHLSLHVVDTASFGKGGEIAHNDSGGVYNCMLSIRGKARVTQLIIHIKTDMYLTGNRA